LNIAIGLEILYYTRNCYKWQWSTTLYSSNVGEKFYLTSWFLVLF